MRCPSCKQMGTKVLDSRPVDNGRAIRRRRECELCHHRFTTFEKVEETPLVVVKKGDNREVFSHEKMLRGLIKACEKRPVPLERLEQLANDVEKALRDAGNSEVNSHEIGELVMNELAKVDEVAYVRFASVYRQFTDINVFAKKIQELKDQLEKEKNSKK
ncbi:transcriptional regulator NrdR [Sporolactobacillus laevolacticus]|uniref:Transcriptional repressor NrdR n=1 Tax=Sporolactobacillus laevolacticus DSM 442 TaxID=1395513 RepID=V6J0V4_9BACL|nr:transcriptional regulator NrdR [Sporolactobacillus laevolacticus]EST13538.1 NrdR family transcriptional regulator [Sporolactobacillus laevolacticus DSM 442]MDN3955627.1 transcriptional regulator NrdR [Sporolactobacillus laevolacticus]